MNSSLKIGLFSPSAVMERLMIFFLYWVRQCWHGGHWPLRTLPALKFYNSTVLWMHDPPFFTCPGRNMLSLCQTEGSNHNRMGSHSQGVHPRVFDHHRNSCPPDYIKKLKWFCLDHFIVFMLLLMLRCLIS